MRKILLIFVTLIVGFSFSMQAQKWDSLAKTIVLETSDVTKVIEQQFREMGLNTTVSCKYDKAEHSVDLILDFGYLDILSYMNQAAYDEFKESFTQAFIESYTEDSDVSDLAEFINIMESGKGKYRIIFKGDGKQHAVPISPDYFRKIARTKCGMKI